MSPTVHDLRNEIRTGVDRFERQTSTGFTKETLAAICAVVGDEVGDGRLPAKSEMRASIADRIDGLDARRDDERPFRNAELATIAAAIDDE